jgi:hypothetical protein
MVHLQLLEKEEKVKHQVVAERNNTIREERNGRG